MCRYNKVPELGLNLFWNRTTAQFVGRGHYQQLGLPKVVHRVLSRHSSH